jgi:hypothetical protein
MEAGFMIRGQRLDDGRIASQPTADSFTDSARYSSGAYSFGVFQEVAIVHDLHLCGA